MVISIRKSIILLLVLVFLIASCVMVAKPASSSADATEDSWASRAPMHVARSSLGVAAVNGKIYAIGGTTLSGMWPSESGGIVDTNEEYDPVKDSWASKTAMPTPRYDFAIAVYQSKIYCIGGSTGISSNGQVFTEANEVYDPATNTWETRAPMPTPRSYLTANVVNDKIYLIGGYVGNVSSGYSYLNLNSVCDPATDSWATKTPMPTASGSHASAVVDNKIYNIDSNLNQIYNPETDTWSLGAPLPLSVKHGAAGATTGVNALKRITLLVIAGL